jgi:hypothetical protein
MGSLSQQPSTEKESTKNKHFQRQCPGFLHQQLFTFWYLYISSLFQPTRTKRRSQSVVQLPVQGWTGWTIMDGQLSKQETPFGVINTRMWEMLKMITSLTRPTHYPRLITSLDRIRLHTIHQMSTQTMYVPFKPQVLQAEVADWQGRDFV